MPEPPRGGEWAPPTDTCPRSAAPATLDRTRPINRPVLIGGTPLTGGRGGGWAPSPESLTVATVNYKANVMSSAIFPLAETVNYTKGPVLLRVPGMLTLCFMASPVKTRSVLRLSRSSPPSLQFYLSCSFREGTKARSRSHNSHQPPPDASDINPLSLSLFVKVAALPWVSLQSDADAGLS